MNIGLYHAVSSISCWKASNVTQRVLAGRQPVCVVRLAPIQSDRDNIILPFDLDSCDNDVYLHIKPIWEEKWFHLILTLNTFTINKCVFVSIRKILLGFNWVQWTNRRVHMTFPLAASLWLREIVPATMPREKRNDGEKERKRSSGRKNPIHEIERRPCAPDELMRQERACHLESAR